MDINCIRSANLTKAILVMDTPQLFHQALSCGHPLFADWVPEKVTEYRNRYYQYDPVYKKIRRLCALSEEDDVAQAIVRCIDGPLCIASAYTYDLTNEPELTPIYAKDKDGNAF